MDPASILFAAAAAHAAQAPVRPVRLQTEPVAGTELLSVVGESHVACSARYRLEVTAGAAGSANRSIQSGVAQLQPGRRVTLVNLRLAGQGSPKVSAILTVEPCGGQPYQQIWTSAD